MSIRILKKASGDHRFDNPLQDILNRPIPVRPFTNDSGNVQVGQLEDCFQIPITFNVAPGTEVTVNNPLGRVPDGVLVELLNANSNHLIQGTKTRLHHAAGMTIPSGAWTKIAFDTVSFDITGESDITNSRYVAEYSGKKLVNGRIELTGAATAAGEMRIAIYKNGAVYSYGNILTRSVNIGGIQDLGHKGIVVSDLIDVDPSDYLELYVYQNFMANANVTGGSATAYMSVYEEIKDLVITQGSTWTADSLGFKCSVDTQSDSLSAKIIVI